MLNLTLVKTIAEAKEIEIPSRKDVLDCAEKYKENPKIDGKFKKIKVNVNHFKIKIKAQALWQYKIAFLPSERGPSVTSREEKWSLFNSFVTQCIDNEGA